MCSLSDNHIRIVCWNIIGHIGTNNNHDNIKKCIILYIVAFYKNNLPFNK